MMEGENAMAKPENDHQIRGRPRQPKGSGDNANGALQYKAGAVKWQCTQREKKYAENDARRAAAHEEAHTKANQKIRRRQEQKSFRKTPIETLAKQGYAHCYNMVQKNEEY